MWRFITDITYWLCLKRPLWMSAWKETHSSSEQSPARGTWCLMGGMSTYRHRRTNTKQSLTLCMWTSAPQGCYSLNATSCKHIPGLNQDPWHQFLWGDSRFDNYSSTKPAPCTSAAPARAVEIAPRGVGPASTTDSAEELTLLNYICFMTSEKPQHLKLKTTWRQTHTEAAANCPVRT